MTNKSWIRYHIGRISGAYIAAVTAFLVSNVSTNPEFIAWLLPTVIGIPLVSVLRRRYFARKKQSANVLQSATVPAATGVR